MIQGSSEIQSNTGFFGKSDASATSFGGADNRPFASCLLPRFQNESWCTTFAMEISLICMTINVQVKLISITKAVHQDSF